MVSESFPCSRILSKVSTWFLSSDSYAWANPNWRRFRPARRKREKKKRKKKKKKRKIRSRESTNSGSHERWKIKTLVNIKVRGLTCHIIDRSSKKVSIPTIRRSCSCNRTHQHESANHARMPICSEWFHHSSDANHFCGTCAMSMNAANFYLVRTIYLACWSSECVWRTGRSRWSADSFSYAFRFLRKTILFATSQIKRE